MKGDAMPQQEIAKSWKNWSGNIVYTPPSDSVFSPNNRTELQEIVNRAAKAGVTLRVSGQRHSQPPLVTDDNRGAPPSPPKAYLVDMSCYADLGPGPTDRMILGPGNNQVTVNPGVREDDVDAFLTKHNLMLATVTAGGFFSIGGMTAVDVHGATVEAPIFAETASAFTILGADGKETTINTHSPYVDGHSPLQFARVSLGALGIVTRITLDVLPRAWATTLQGNKKRYLLKDKQAFVGKYKELLTGPMKHTRLESFYTPYAAAPNLPVVPPMPNFLALWWDVVADPKPETRNSAADPESACALSKKNEFGAPYLGVLGTIAAPVIRENQEAYSAYYPVPTFPGPAAITAIALDVIEKQVEAANKIKSDLWLTEATRVLFMSYFIELPGFDEAGLGKAWEGLEVVADYVTTDGNFHIAAPLEFRFVKGGDSAMSGTFSKSPNASFVNLDLIGFVDEDERPSDYPPALLKFFAHVERKWVSLGGLPHNGKMYGFYDPTDRDKDSFTPPFNKKFLSFITRERIETHQAPVDAFKKYRTICDPADRFYNQYLRDLLDG
jgi:hypothetical protein